MSMKKYAYNMSSTELLEDIKNCSEERCLNRGKLLQKVDLLLEKLNANIFKKYYY